MRHTIRIACICAVLLTTVAAHAQEASLTYPSADTTSETWGGPCPMSTGGGELLAPRVLDRGDGWGTDDGGCGGPLDLIGDTAPGDLTIDLRNGTLLPALTSRRVFATYEAFRSYMESLGAQPRATVGDAVPPEKVQPVIVVGNDGDGTELPTEGGRIAVTAPGLALLAGQYTEIVIAGRVYAVPTQDQLRAATVESVRVSCNAERSACIESRTYLSRVGAFLTAGVRTRWVAGGAAGCDAGVAEGLCVSTLGAELAYTGADGQTGAVDRSVTAAGSLDVSMWELDLAGAPAAPPVVCGRGTGAVSGSTLLAPAVTGLGETGRCPF